MKKVIRSATDFPLTDRQYKKAQALMKAYQTVYDILDDTEFDEDGEFFPLLNSPDIYQDIEDEIRYLSARL